MCINHAGRVDKTFTGYANISLREHNRVGYTEVDRERKKEREKKRERDEYLDEERESEREQERERDKRLERVQHG